MATEITSLILHGAAFVLESSRACVHPEDGILYAVLLNQVCIFSCMFKVRQNTCRLATIYLT